MTDTCEHQYQHLETSKWTSDGTYLIKWVKVDRFFCTHCLHISEVRREEWSREQPEWYR